MTAREVMRLAAVRQCCPGARPSHPDWLRSLRDQCTAAGAPFFFKQWGDWAPWDSLGQPGRVQDLADGTRMQQLGKKRAGAQLDGREWREVPRG